MLALLGDIVIRRPTDRIPFEKSYSTAQEHWPQSLSFEELIEQGWLEVWFDRVILTRSAREILRRFPPQGLEALASLLPVFDDKAFSFGEATLTDETLGPIAQALIKDEARWHDLACRSPAWVAGELWKRAAVSGAGLRLQWWHARWLLLGEPSFVISDSLDADQAAAFRAAALDLMTPDQMAPAWADIRRRLLNFYIASFGDIDAAEARVPPLPNTLLERADWLKLPAMEESEILLFGGPLHGLVRLLVLDLVSADYRTPALNAGQILISRSKMSPNLLAPLLWEARRQPRVYADLLASPDHVPLALLEIAAWRDSGRPRASGATVHDVDEAHGRRTMLADALGVLSNLASQNKAPIPDCAALLARVNDSYSRRYGPELPDRDELRSQYRQAWSRWPVSSLEAIGDWLAATVEARLDDPAFRALLDLTAHAPVAKESWSEVLIDAYEAALTPGVDVPSASDLSPASCAALWNAASVDTGRPDRFLRPFDPASLIQGALAEQQAQALDRVARSLRTHVRVLARAIQACDPGGRKPLADALAHYVLAGSKRSLPKGRCDAFAPRFEISPIALNSERRPIAGDLVPALQALDDVERPSLIRSLLATDEPYLLGELAWRAPGLMRTRVKTRMSDLPPSAAAQVLLITDGQARIDALVSAGLTDAAQLYMAEQHKLLIGRSRPAAELALFQAEARLLAASGDLQALTALSPPDDLRPFEAEEALDAVKFQRAVLLSKRGEPEATSAARDLFLALQRKRPHITGYALNALAMDIQAVLGDDAFGVIAAERARDAQGLVERAEALMPQLADDDRVILGMNLSLLELALGRPDRALVALDAAGTENAPILALRSMALFRSGHVETAKRALADAQRIDPEADLVRAAGDAIAGRQSSGGTSSNHTFVTAENDPVAPIQSALHQLNRLSSDQIARAWGFSDVGSLVRRQVSQAGASLVALRSAMRTLSLDSMEDDISEVLRELLRARLEPYGWAVADQSKGGYSARGNPGERDLVVHHGASEVAVLEAVVCRRSLATVAQVEDLRSHFVKLFGYGKHRLRFHLTYAQIADMKGMLSVLERIAQEDAPAGFTYLEHTPIHVDGTEPPWLAARYADDLGESVVFFHVIDLHQAAERAASATAAGGSKSAP